jgi:hypothetical protein
VDFELMREGQTVRNRKTGRRYQIIGFDRDIHQFGVTEDTVATLDPLDGGRIVRVKVTNLEY